MVAIKYQTTEKDAEETAFEIAEEIRDIGGTQFSLTWDEAGNVTGVRFVLRTDEWGNLPVQLEAQTEKIADILWDDGLWSSFDDDERLRRLRKQAHRIAWRHLKHIIEGLIGAIKIGLAEPLTVLMGFVEVQDPQTQEQIPMSTFFSRYAESLRSGEVELLPPQ